MANYGEKIKGIIDESINTKRRLMEEMQEHLVSCALTLAGTIRSGGKILICGNGGSAAEAQHLASELIGKLWRFERPAIPAIALTTDSSIMTSLSNDYGFENCFVRQVEALGKPGDALVAITTSGKSPNIINAVNAAKINNLKTIGILGSDGGGVLKLVDDYILVPSAITPRIQESHHLINHILASVIEEELYGTGI